MRQLNTEQIVRDNNFRSDVPGAQAYLDVCEGFNV